MDVQVKDQYATATLHRAREVPMTLHRRILAVSCVAALASFGATSAMAHGSASASASATSSESARLASRYADFAGSQSNAAALVAGLRSGSAFALNSTSAAGALTQTTITPATKAMGYGEVNIALSLAKAELVKNGITDPTPQQIQAALDGGTLTTSKGSVTLTGVLAMRQQGQGWGQIANGLGFKLGDLVSASETGNSQAGMHGQAGVNGTVDTGAADASAHAAANASLHATLPAHVNLPQRPDVPAVVRPNIPVHVGIGGGG
jgi:hypothetical protein